MEISDKKLTIWKHVVKRMNEEDLEFILDFPECHEPQILKLVEQRLEEISQPQDDDFFEEEDTIEAAFLENIDELGCVYVIDEDGDIQFEYRNEKFTILLHENRPFITITNYNLLTIDLDNYHEVTKMYSAINTTNSNGHIVVTYHINKEDNMIHVHSHTTTLFNSYIPNRVGYFELLLSYFFHTQQFQKDQMAEVYESKQPPNSIK